MATGQVESLCGGLANIYKIKEKKIKKLKI